jgi:hypothetical protein
LNRGIITFCIIIFKSLFPEMEFKNIIKISKAEFDYETYCLRFYIPSDAVPLINVSVEWFISNSEVPDDLIITGVKLHTQYVILFGFSEAFLEPVPEGAHVQIKEFL